MSPGCCVMDSWLVDKLDAAMTWAQQRGVSLVAVHCWVMAAVLFMHVGRSIIERDAVDIVVSGICWGGAFYFYLRWAERSWDYRENMRLAQKLNAEAIGARDGERRLRRVGAPLLMVAVVLFDLPQAILSDTILGGLHALATLLVILLVYLNTSTFLAGGVPRSRSVPNGVRADG